MAQSYLPDGECGVKDQVSRRFIVYGDQTHFRSGGAFLLAEWGTFVL